MAGNQPVWTRATRTGWAGWGLVTRWGGLKTHGFAGTASRVRMNQRPWRWPTTNLIPITRLTRTRWEPRRLTMPRLFMTHSPYPQKKRRWEGRDRGRWAHWDRRGLSRVTSPTLRPDARPRAIIRCRPSCKSRPSLSTDRTSPPVPTWSGISPTPN